MAMAEKEQDHRHGLDRIAARFDIILSGLGMSCAFVITMVALACATWLAIHGHELAGGIVGAGGISLIVAKFLRGSEKGK